MKAEVSELEIVISGKQQLEESMLLLNKQKTSQFRTNMLMKWSRPGAPGAGGEGADAAVAAAGGFTPRTMARKQARYLALYAVTDDGAEAGRVEAGACCSRGVLRSSEVGTAHPDGSPQTTSLGDGSP